ncbi:3-octaprenyl-4-hydroxybenzoate carboxy-lyase domain protein [Burkholderia pseudomallei]|nr:3-octaprenyl-4-hydroxybenzoate carboxy-lyase domain protein [Burkholderia pseudomallei]
MAQERRSRRGVRRRRIGAGAIRERAENGKTLPVCPGPARRRQPCSRSPCHGAVSGAPSANMSSTRATVWSTISSIVFGIA